MANWFRVHNSNRNLNCIRRPLAIGYSLSITFLCLLCPSAALPEPLKAKYGNYCLVRNDRNQFNKAHTVPGNLYRLLAQTEIQYICDDRPMNTRAPTSDKNNIMRICCRIIVSVCLRQKSSRKESLRYNSNRVNGIIEVSHSCSMQH